MGFFIFLSLVFSIIILAISTAIKFQRNKKETNKFEEVVPEVNKTLTPQNDFDLIEQFNPISFSHLSLKNKSLQLLESLEIIENTQRIDTLIGRIEFINTLIPDLISASKYENYHHEVQFSIDKYKTMYYDRFITSTQMQILLYPNEDTTKQHFANCILSCYEKYVSIQEKEILKLVRIAAIQKRKDDIIKQGYSAKYLFKTYNLPDNGQLEKIEQIRKKFYAYQGK